MAQMGEHSTGNTKSGVQVPETAYKYVFHVYVQIAKERIANKHLKIYLHI